MIVPGQLYRVHPKEIEDDGHHGKHHDCPTALTHGLLSLLHGLIIMDNAGLLLFEAEKIVDLGANQCQRTQRETGTWLTFSALLSALALGPDSSCMRSSISNNRLSE